MALLALPSFSLSGLHPANPKPANTLFPTITHKHQESVLIYARIIRLPNYGVKRKVGNDTTMMPVPEYEKDQNFRNILLSDVVVMKRRNVFWGRKWCFWDVFSLGWMVSVHLLCLFAPFTFNWGAFWVAFALYIVTGLLGITLSYHRHLSHRSFKIPKWLEYFFAYCGVLAGQRDPIFWVSTHRYHHQFCDSEKDPHSPVGGFWFSHISWFFNTKSIVDKCGEPNNAGDLEKQPFYKFLQSTYITHLVALGALLYALGGLPYFVWGLGVRMVWVYHITFLVNSACHVWGKQSWNTGDFSKNNWWVAVLSFGEGWHNNHHAFEYSARHGLEWWQIDMTWYLIRFLEAIGLATDVKLPTSAQMQRMQALTIEVTLWDLQCGEPNNVGGLEKQPFYKFLQKTCVIHLLAPGAILYALGGLPYLVWGLGVRLVCMYHGTFLVNSACHVWGKQAWNTGDFSKNNWWVAVLTFGDGWHNNHHAFEYSARQGLEWWQIDMTWYVIRFLEAIGLATGVKLPTSAQKQRMASTTEGNQ